MSAMAMAIIPVAMVIASTAYWLYALGCVVGFRRRPRPTAAGMPPVTILKPLCGAHPRLYETLRSFCEQDYPDVQILFGVRDPADPAVDVVDRLMDEYRARNLKLVVNIRTCPTPRSSPPSSASIGASTSARAR